MIEKTKKEYTPPTVSKIEVPPKDRFLLAACKDYSGETTGDIDGMFPCEFLAYCPYAADS